MCRNTPIERAAGQALAAACRAHVVLESVSIEPDEYVIALENAYEDLQAATTAMYAEARRQNSEAASRGL